MFDFCEAWLFCKTNKQKNLFTTKNLGAVAAGLLYKSVLGLCLNISRAARYLPKPALNNIPSLCVNYDLYECHLESKIDIGSYLQVLFLAIVVV